MKTLTVAFVLAFILPFKSFCQKNPFGLAVINSYSEYLATVKADSNNRLVEIRKYIPGITLDIRYATKNNFAGVAVYKKAKAFARLPVVMALKKVQEDLNKRGLGLKIYDGYRPYAVTVKFYQVASDKNFVANPNKGSRHNRGCAIDLSIIDLKTRHEIEMPTPYDSFDPKAASNYPDLPENVRANRDLLKLLMVKHGFRPLENEWWHFDFASWEKYPLMDIPFEEL